MDNKIRFFNLKIFIKRLLSCILACFIFIQSIPTHVYGNELNKINTEAAVTSSLYCYNQNKEFDRKEEALNIEYELETKENKESEAEPETEESKESEAEPETEESKESEAEPESEENKESEIKPETEENKESEAESETEESKESEVESETKENSESEGETKSEESLEIEGNKESVSDIVETIESESETLTDEISDACQMPVYFNGRIKIYNIEQLNAIGTDMAVMTGDCDPATFGSGKEIYSSSNFSESVLDNKLTPSNAPSDKLTSSNAPSRKRKKSSIASDDNKKLITYSLDAEYEIVNDITLDSNKLWMLPENFTGSFFNSPKDKARLYDAETDTIYIYNNYQLMLASSENAELEPVMSGDINPENIGIGHFLLKTEKEDIKENTENINKTDDKTLDTMSVSDKGYLTYSCSHNYILSKDFTEHMPNLKANEFNKGTSTDIQKAGREYIGQCYKIIDGEKYILIGNEQQLRAIGTDKQVTPMLFLKTEAKLLGASLGHKIVPYYPGDADFNIKSIKNTDIKYKDIKDGTENFQYLMQKDNPAVEELMNVKWDYDTLVGEVVGVVGGLLTGVLGELLGKKEIVGLKLDEKGVPSIGAKSGGLFTEDEFTTFTQLEHEYKNLKYSSDANYIIFRDIDLSQGEFSNNKADDWIPLSLSGKLEGRKNMEVGNPPVIRNINILQTGKLNMETTGGIGFFGTISNKTDDTTLDSSGEVIVKDIHLDNIKVVNESTVIDDNPKSLVDGITKILGGLLGGLLDGLLDLLKPILGIELGDIVRGLLELKKKSGDLFATGSFAGRIQGQVRIENCIVTNAEVSSQKGISGGFVGYTEGMEKYEGLSGLLGDVVKLLSALLNILPGVGLGDLITILLQNDVPLGQLIPTGYYNPIISNCRVSLTTGQIGNINQDYNGGFVGVQIGTKIDNSHVSGLKLVQAKNGAGGFAGVERDAVIRGLLNDIGVQLYTLDIKSRQDGCTTKGTDFKVETAEDYAGGFNGLMANSIASGALIDSISSVKALKYAGGFAGRATIGFGTSIGGIEQNKANLLNSITKLLGDIVASGDTGKLNVLLSLVGIAPSEIHGANIKGNNLEVIAGEDYSGGVIGKGDGVKINKGVSHQHGALLSGISSVNAKNYAGGIIGSAVTADVIGVLNNTVGVGQYIPFEISDTNVNEEGTPFSVIVSDKYAAGAAGLMLGGEVNRVKINNLEKVIAGNYSAGFAGRTGAQGLASTGGLDILGLVKINNVLSLAKGLRVVINDSRVEGVNTGFTVSATGIASITDGEDFTAGGFIGEAVASKINNSHVINLKEVIANRTMDKGSYAGGYVGRSHTGGLAGLAEKESDGVLKLPGILDISSLLSLVPYLVPEYLNTTVSYISNANKAQVKAQHAGGFAGAVQSGIVDNSSRIDDYFAVYNLEKVEGEAYAGGFAGKADAGATASSDGLKLLSGILKLNISNLIDVLNVYIPIMKFAGVKSLENGFTVEATDKDSSAGGYIGYGSGVHIESSDVTSLRHTRVTPPGDSLESKNGSSYFGNESAYAVKGGKYAGGFIGCSDIDSAAAAGGGIKLLDGIKLDSVLSVLQTVASTIKDSNVNGCIGGFSVLANGINKAGNIIGKAGGFAGSLSGTFIERCNVNNFHYIIGREMAGGYAGLMEPGDVAAVVEDGSVLGGLLNIGDSLASLVKSFISSIEDSSTSCVPCGGAVRADGFTDSQTVRGIAGGYVGYNHGSRILGANKACEAIRIRSVYGGEFSGGFTGLMETADLTGTGNLKLLYGLLETSNLLSLLGAVYPTETNTAVYGPLRKLDIDTWNAWADAVGSGGVYGDQFPTEHLNNELELAEFIKNYAYGYNIKAGRETPGTQAKEAGSAGGYVGCMNGGVITEAHAWDSKSIIGYKAAGGFAGELVTGGVAKIGKLSLLDLPIVGSINAVQTFVPVIRNSDVTGFQSGLSVKATGVPISGNNLKIEKNGYAGGYAGHILGGQIWGNWSDVSFRSVTDAIPDPNNNRCFVANLRRVDGTNSVGGFAGRIDPASASALDTAGSTGLLGGLLQNLIKAPGDLLSLLSATLSTVRAADVKSWDKWGIVINGSYTNDTNNTAYAKAAGGFAGEIYGAVIGQNNNPENGVHLTDIRSVTAGEYAGGFFGLADVSAVAEVSGAGNTSILASLVGLGSTDVLDSFRTYIYFSDVAGTLNSGLDVRARTAKKLEYVNNPVYTGTAGGFGGSLLNGSVKHSKVTKLRSVEGQNYTGGFIGHLGKSGTVDVDQLGILHKLLEATVGIMDVFGSHIDNSSVEGLESGFTVKSNNIAEKTDRSEIAGGFAGFADLARMSGNSVINLKQVSSHEIAGGFAGRTSFAYLVNLKAESPFVNILLGYLNTILKALWVQALEQGQILKINLGLITVEAFRDGDLIHLELLGLDIKIALAKDKQLATIYIGNSKIELNCAEDGSILNNDAVKNELNIALVKANRSKIADCSVRGIPIGYDVYGGGSGNYNNGTDINGYAGGFVGLNDEGLFKNNEMYLADVVRGTEGKVGPFTGASSLESNWEFDTVFGIEGNHNEFRIYRPLNPDYNKLMKNNRVEIQEEFNGSPKWNIYTVKHMTKNKVIKFGDLKDAVISDGTHEMALMAYQENGAMAVLMENTPTENEELGEELIPPDLQDPCKDIIELRIQKIWMGDSINNRPEQVIFHIKRKYEANGQIIVDESFNHEVILSNKDFITENIWERLISDPLFTAYKVGDNGEKYYYTYYLAEDKVNGYDTTISYQGKYQYNIIVTNRKNNIGQILPETGGSGVVWIYNIGILLLAIFIILEYKKKQFADTE